MSNPDMPGSQPPESGQRPSGQALPRKKKRIFMWVFLAIQAVFIIWLVSGIASTSDSCAGLTGQELDACRAGAAVGAGISVLVIVFLWAAVDLILGITYLITRRR